MQTTTGGYVTTAGSGGSYTLANVDPGTYVVQAAMAGYLTEQTAGVVVTEGQATTVNFNLAPEAPFEGLVNGDFEGGAFDDPDVDHRTGNGWHQFTRSGWSKSGVTWFGSGAHSMDLSRGRRSL